MMTIHENERKTMETILAAAIWYAAWRCKGEKDIWLGTDHWGPTVNATDAGAEPAGTILATTVTEADRGMTIQESDCRAAEILRELIDTKEIYILKEGQ